MSAMNISSSREDGNAELSQQTGNISEASSTIDNVPEGSSTYDNLELFEIVFHVYSPTANKRLKFEDSGGVLAVIGNVPELGLWEDVRVALHKAKWCSGYFYSDPGIAFEVGMFPA